MNAGLQLHHIQDLLVKLQAIICDLFLPLGSILVTKNVVLCGGWHGFASVNGMRPAAKYSTQPFMNL